MVCPELCRKIRMFITLLQLVWKLLNINSISRKFRKLWGIMTKINLAVCSPENKFVIVYAYNRATFAHYSSLLFFLFYLWVEVAYITFFSFPLPRCHRHFWVPTRRAKSAAACPRRRGGWPDGHLPAGVFTPLYNNRPGAATAARRAVLARPPGAPTATPQEGRCLTTVAEDQNYKRKWRL